MACREIRRGSTMGEAAATEEADDQGDAKDRGHGEGSEGQGVDAKDSEPGDGQRWMQAEGT